MYFSWGSSLGKELKYIYQHIYYCLYTCKDGLCTGDIDLPGYAHVLPGITWGRTCVAVHTCVINSIWFSQ